MPVTRLGAQNLGRSFGPVHALRDVTFSAKERTIHALLGENGAGKTTLIRALGGLDRPDTGSVIVNDKPVRFTGPRDAFAAGIAVVQQELALSPELTLLENLVLGNEPVSAGRIRWREAQQRGEQIAESIGSSMPWKKRAGEVEVGVQQQLEIIRCLYRGADTLILDEPSAVLAPAQIEALLELLGRLRDGGTTIILITHKLEESLAVSDDVTVLRGGRVVHSQPAQGLSRAQLSRMVVGEDVAQTRAARSTDPGRPILILRDLVVAGRNQRVGPVDLEVRAGEILGIAGVAGNGQEELVEAITGLRTPSSGTIEIDGQDVTSSSVADRRAAGMSYVSPDRRHEGLSVTESLVDNVIVGCHRRAPVARRGILSRAKARTYAVDLLDRFGVRYGSATGPVSALSGGNQQKLVFGREMSLQPQLLLAAQPTRGVDVKGIADLSNRLLAARDSGVAIILLSQELDEIIGLSDRVVVMFRGQRSDPIDPRDPGARVQIGNAMMGQDSGSVSPGGSRPSP